MEKIFLKNAVLPGHKDFLYDKQVDFNTEKYTAEWDDEDEENEECEDHEADENDSYFQFIKLIIFIMYRITAYFLLIMMD